ncbi:MAG: hypothetical protein FD180_3147 [Planctomycetota bacterium]|nr:MAG: hypothetical protein FD180_3147 [Planctomycetota bacterium]
MSGNGCSCEGSPAPAAAPAAATPCGSGAQYTHVVWESLALGANLTVVSLPFSARGANALDFIIMTITASGSIQTAFQAQGSNDDGSSWTNIGSAGQSTAVGYAVMGPITGNGFAKVRLVAVEQLGVTTMFTIVCRLFCG